MSDHFTHICAIDAATVKRSEAQFRLRQMDSAAPTYSTPSRSTRSTSAPSSSTSDVSLGDIMVQLQCMDAHLDTLSIELYQVNVRLGHIVRRQAIMGGFAPEDEDDDDGDDDDASNDDDGDASSTDDIST